MGILKVTIKKKIYESKCTIKCVRFEWRWVHISRGDWVRFGIYKKLVRVQLFQVLYFNILIWGKQIKMRFYDWSGWTLSIETNPQEKIYQQNYNINVNIVWYCNKPQKIIFNVVKLWRETCLWIKMHEASYLEAFFRKCFSRIFSFE